MLENTYLPEGSLIATKENSEYLSCLQGLERALAQGKILEAVAIQCDGEMNLTVDLGCIFGYISKNECAFNSDGDSVKDIAIISRVGKPVCFKILSICRDENNQIIAKLSRRLAQIECMNNYIMSLMGGDIISARVTHLEHFGAFVDIGCGVVSLLSIDCISVSRISHPKDRFYVGMSIKVVVKSVDYISGRVCVSHKELLGTWEENASKFCIGQTVMGVVRSVEEYGIFVELAPNLAGLAEYKAGVVVGQMAAVYIKNIIPDRMKIKLVIIDSCKNESPGRKLDYYVEPNAEHMDYWKYSPSGTCKVIESRFV